MYKRIAITPGEPAGIGPELVVQLAQQSHDCELIVIADPGLLEQRASLLNLPLTMTEFDASQPPSPQQPGSLTIAPVSLTSPSQPGTLNQANANYVLTTLANAVEGCVNGCYHAMVTGPVNKGIINEAGIPFSGHTEFLAEQTNTQHVVMMLATADLRVALATTHLPLNQVSQAITFHSLEHIITILQHDLSRKFSITAPRILVCGLNPHAGEDGHLGTEEIDTIIPVLNKLRHQGMNLIGPLAADTLFTPKNLSEADAVLAMYHDQGLPVLKHKGFGHAINITLGLPILRTSVDHGTALDLAGTGQASISSFEYAIQTAINMNNV